MAGLHTFIASCALALCLILSCAHATNSPGCGRYLSSSMKLGGMGQSNRLSFKTSKGVQRSYLLHFPTNYNKNMAHGLIFSFHGRSKNAIAQENLSKLSDPAKNPHMLVVYPEGIENQWQGDPAAKTDDVGFVLDMIDSLGKQYCIDTDMIYATGMSNGGGFSANVLACHPVASRKIAAFAGVSGAYYQGSTDRNCNGGTVPIACNPGRKPVPVLEFHGEADATIPYKGGPRRNRCLPNLPHFMQSWASRNGLGTGNVSTTMLGGHVKKYEFGPGKGVQGVNTHYWVDGMGHTWPNARANYMNATPVVMDFFNKWTLKTTPMSGYYTKAKRSVPVDAASSPIAHSAPKPRSDSGSICPAQHDKIVASGAARFQIACDAHTPDSPYGPVTFPGSLAACIATCAADDRCGHIEYREACYLKFGKPTEVGRGGGGGSVAVKAQ